MAQPLGIPADGPELVDGLFGGADGPPPPPAIVVFVDCWTSVGGSQFLDSPGTGRYHTYLCDEVVPWVDATFRTPPRRDHRGITGKSSGGYGAMVTPMLRPDLFGGLATHAGDALFEACYATEFAECARALRDRYDGSFERFWDRLPPRPAMTRPEDGALVNEWAMAACYSTDDDGTVRLPFDLTTGELVPEVWQRWLRWDPVRMARTPTEAPRRSGRCGRSTSMPATRDEYYLDLGAEAFRQACLDAGAPEPASSSSTPDTARSSTATRMPSGTSPSTCRPTARPPPPHRLRSQDEFGYARSRRSTVPPSDERVTR